MVQEVQQKTSTVKIVFSMNHVSFFGQLIQNEKERIIDMLWC